MHQVTMGLVPPFRRFTGGNYPEARVPQTREEALGEQDTAVYENALPVVVGLVQDTFTASLTNRGLLWEMMMMLILATSGKCWGIGALKG